MLTRPQANLFDLDGTLPRTLSVLGIAMENAPELVKRAAGAVLV